MTAAFSRRCTKYAFGLALAIVGSLLLMTSGCMMVQTRLQPEDTSIKESLRGEDCVLILFGIGFGTATAEQAMANATDYYDPSGLVRGQITKIRRTEYRELLWLIIARRCVIVVGE